MRRRLPCEPRRPRPTQDILVALNRCQRFREYLQAGDDALSGMALDAILRNLAVVGEAARKLTDDARALFPAAPWHSIAGLRNVVIHEYFRIDVAIIRDIVDNEVAPLADAIRKHLDADTDDAADEQR